jgi:hypothetical protein
MFGNCCLLDLCNAIAVVDQIAAADLKARPKRFSFEILKGGCVIAKHKMLRIFAKLRRGLSFWVDDIDIDPALLRN